MKSDFTFCQSSLLDEQANKIVWNDAKGGRKVKKNFVIRVFDYQEFVFYFTNKHLCITYGTGFISS